jgi:hypothetical protein
MTQEALKREAKAVLEEEANQLALLVDFGKFKDMPHRVGIAITREIKRLRAMAEAVIEEEKEDECGEEE